MAIDGIQAFAKCAACGTVMWTDVRQNAAETDQACICKCGATRIENTIVSGSLDETFDVTTLDELEQAEAMS